MAFNVSGLQDYVNQNSDNLIKKAVLGADTIAKIGKQYDITYKEALQLIDVDAPLQDGSACGFSAKGDTTFSQKEIEVKPLKVNQEFCEKELRKKWMNYLVNTSAKADSLPFEQYIVDATAEKINEQIEKLIWQGDTASTGSTEYLKLMDGFLKKFDNDSEVVDVAIPSGTSAYESIKKVVMALPQELVDKGAVVFVGSDLYRQFIMELMEKNLYHYNEKESASKELLFPGLSTKVIGVNGLTGTGALVGAIPTHLVYGSDMANEQEVFDFFFDKSSRTFKNVVEFVAGVEYPYGDEVIYGKIAKA